MIKFLKCVFGGGHDLQFVRNVYGDEINALNARSIWKCRKCGSVKYGRQLYSEEGQP